jgi:Arc/MetJ-type ribon-helix-helix transcriptional regulator
MRTVWSVDLGIDLKADLENHCHKGGHNRSDVIRYALHEYLARRGYIGDKQYAQAT